MSDRQSHGHSGRFRILNPLIHRLDHISIPIQACCQLLTILRRGEQISAGFVVAARHCCWSTWLGRACLGCTSSDHELRLLYAIFHRLKKFNRLVELLQEIHAVASPHHWLRRWCT